MPSTFSVIPNAVRNPLWMLHYACALFSMTCGVTPSVFSCHAKHFFCHSEPERGIQCGCFTTLVLCSEHQPIILKKTAQSSCATLSPILTRIGYGAGFSHNRNLNLTRILHRRGDFIGYLMGKCARLLVADTLAFNNDTNFSPGL